MVRCWSWTSTISVQFRGARQKEEMEKVSIILTSYNRPEWLKNAIESVIAQTHANWELWIMDDNSPDPNLRHVVAPYMVDRRINFHQCNTTYANREEKCRYADMINMAYPWTTGKYISYLTDDDDFLPRRLEVMVNHLEANPDHKVVYGQQLVYDDGFPNSGFTRAPQGPLAQAASLVDHCSIMHDRQVGIDVGLWDSRPEMWGHADAIFWQRLNDAGHMFWPVDFVLDRHRQSRDGAQNKMMNGRMPYQEW